mgnify:CR=1 FL=1
MNVNELILDRVRSLVFTDLNDGSDIDFSGHVVGKGDFLPCHGELCGAGCGAKGILFCQATALKLVDVLGPHRHGQAQLWYRLPERLLQRRRCWPVQRDCGRISSPCLPIINRICGRDSTFVLIAAVSSVVSFSSAEVTVSSSFPHSGLPHTGQVVISFTAS